MFFVDLTLPWFFLPKDIEASLYCHGYYMYDTMH